MRFFLWSGMLLFLAGLSPSPAAAQIVSSGEIRPFVVGLVPVIGNSGVVGGISIDAKGAVSRSNVETLGRLRDLRLQALATIDSDVAAVSPMRKISLRGLSVAIQQSIASAKALDHALQNLAGLTRVEY